MLFKTLHTIVKMTAILLWLIFAVAIIVLILNHNFWNMMPIIAHNQAQNWLGWELIFAVVLSLCSPILKKIARGN